MSTWLLLLALIVFYLPWISMYKFMALADYKRRWRAFVPGWNFLLMYDLANAGRGNVLWLLAGLPAAIVILIVATFFEASDTGVSEGQTMSFDPIVWAAVAAVVAVPACLLIAAVVGRLAERTARKKSLGIIAGLPLVWMAGLPYLGLTAKVNAGMKPDYVPLPPLTSSFSNLTRRT